MINPADLESIAKKLVDVLPQGLGQVPEGLESQVKTILSTSLQKLDLVTREEYDIQVGVLSKTRIKLEALEKQLDELQQKIES